MNVPNRLKIDVKVTLGYVCSADGVISHERIYPIVDATVSFCCSARSRERESSPLAQLAFKQKLSQCTDANGQKDKLSGSKQIRRCARFVASAQSRACEALSMSQLECLIVCLLVCLFVWLMLRSKLMRSEV